MSLYFKKAAIALILSAVFACSKNRCEQAPDVSNIALSIDIIRLEDEIEKITDIDEADAFLKKYPLFSEKFMRRSDFPHDSIPAGNIVKLATDLHIDTLIQDCKQEFGDMSDLKAELETAFKRVKYYYPDFVPPVVMTVVTGFGHDLYVSDSLIVIGLDYFLGEGGKYRPQMPGYMLARYKKNFIVPSIIMLLSDKYNAGNPMDKTVMAEMIYYGKAFHFCNRMLPCTGDSVLLGYTSEQMNDVNAHKSDIWAHFVKENIFFESSHFIVQKYVGEAPSVQSVGPKCPGRIGRWLGLEIVNKYMDEKKLTLQQLMEEPDAKKIFDEAKYKPVDMR